jgi:hypothetical protein
LKALLRQYRKQKFRLERSDEQFSVRSSVRLTIPFGANFVSSASEIFFLAGFDERQFNHADKLLSAERGRFDISQGIKKPLRWQFELRK